MTESSLDRSAVIKLFCTRSSGILIILPASGNGTFHARFGDARALVRGTVSTKSRDGKTYMNVDNLDVVLAVKDVQMRVSKVFNNNRILSKRYLQIRTVAKNCDWRSRRSKSTTLIEIYNINMSVREETLTLRFIYLFVPHTMTLLLMIPAAEATNLFLRENGQEVLKVMEPQLKRKLSALFAGIVNQLLRHVPVESFLIP